MRCSVFLLLILLLAPTAAGQVRLGPQGPEVPTEQGRTGPQPDEPQLYEITIQPADEPQPPLKYSLVPDFLAQEPGNAAPYYYRALLAFDDLRDGHQRQEAVDPWKRAGELMESPIEEFSVAEAQKALQGFDSVYKQLQIAAYREYCDWDWRLHDIQGPQALSFLLGEIQDMRGVARLLTLKARMEIAQGRYEEAIATLRIGYQLAQDVAQPPTIINALVGLAVVNMMHEQVLALIDAEGSPNLYWALAGLPNPLIDMSDALRYEASTPLIIFPFLQDAETAERTPEQWQAVLVQAIKDLDALGGELLPGGSESELDQQAQLLAAAIAVKDYPRAKRELIQQGYDPTNIEQMPVGQVLALYQLHLYRHTYQELFKWTLLPYEQAWQGLKQSEKRLQEEGYLGRPQSMKEPLPISRVLLPATSFALQAPVRQQSFLTGLRTLEAIRMHAAQTGQLPKTLEEITVVPVPRNPATGTLLPYSVQGQQTTLEIPPAANAPANSGWRLEIRK